MALKHKFTSLYEHCDKIWDFYSLSCKNAETKLLCV